MKVLWLCNIVLPELCDVYGFRKRVFGGWIVGMWNHLSMNSDYELAVCVPIRDEKNMKDGQFNSYEYYSFLFSENTSGQEVQVDRFKEILKSYRPDVIHIWGTEYIHTWCMISACKELGLLNRVIINLQGLISEYSLVYNAYLSDGIVEKDRMNMESRSLYEIKSIQEAKYVSGRTKWDEKCSKIINPNIEYLYCGEILRDIFYTNNQKWEYKNCKKHNIFMSQASYPIKGFHIILPGIAELKKEYTDLQVEIAGVSPIVCGGEYGNFVDEEIKKYRLEKTIIFIGNQTDEEMYERYLHANLFLSASVIENSPNSVCEAMMVGVPVVSSNVGGVSSIIHHGDNGMLFGIKDINQMVENIRMIFENVECANNISHNAIVKVKKYNDRQACYEQQLKNYSYILENVT